MTVRSLSLVPFVMLVAVFLAGCTGPTEKATQPSDSTTSADAPAKPAAESSPDAAAPAADATAGTPAAPAADSPTPPTPFDPPATLEELDKKVEWEDQPVRDSLKLFKEHWAETKQIATVPEALKLKNNSAADNDKILNALGRPPANDKDANWNAKITRHLLGDINSPNPIMQNSIHEFDVVPLHSMTMITFDWTLTPYADADVVSSWQSSKDRMCDKIVLRKDITWSDGKPVTAKDIAFSFKAIMNEKIPVPAVRQQTDQLRDVVAYDDATVVIFHKEPLATNVWNMEFPIIPEHVYGPLFKQLDKLSWEELLQKPEYQKYEVAPLSSSAYKMVSRTHNQEIVFKRREDWYMHDGKQVRDKPYFEEIRFRVITDPNTALLSLMSGGIDEYEIHQEQWASQTNGADFYEKNTKARGVEWTYFYFGWNNNSPSAPFFKEQKVREAMSYAFDYKEMFDKLLFGLCEPCTSIEYPTAWMAPKTPLKPYQQDQEKAEKLLDEAGWVDSDGNGVRDKMVNGKRVQFEFTMLVRNDPERVRICELMKFNLEQIGVKCNIRPMEATALLQRLLDLEFEAEFGGWGSGSDPDTSENVWATKYIPKKGRNFLQYSNPEVDRLFEAGRKEFNREKRGAIYAKICEIIYRDQPCTFLYWRNSFWGFNKELRGYMFSPRNPFHYSPGFMSIWHVN
jgi:peptide/nickel transport system substrate-binding protein